MPILNFLSFFHPFSLLIVRRYRGLRCLSREERETCDHEIQEEGWGKVRQAAKRLDRVKRA